jgi:hypothetical protein
LPRVRGQSRSGVFDTLGRLASSPLAGGHELHIGAFGGCLGRATDFHSTNDGARHRKEKGKEKGDILLFVFLRRAR